MQSEAATVDAYIAEATPERAEALTRLRDLARRTLTDHEEGMAYGMPSYARDGQGEFAFANQKQYLSLYFPPVVIGAHAAALAGHNLGKCCLRFRNPAKIDWSLIELLLISARDAADTVQAS